MSCADLCMKEKYVRIADRGEEEGGGGTRMIRDRRIMIDPLY